MDMRDAFPRRSGRGSRADASREEPARLRDGPPLLFRPRSDHLAGMTRSPGPATMRLMNNWVDFSGVGVEQTSGCPAPCCRLPHTGIAESAPAGRWKTMMSRTAGVYYGSRDTVTCSPTRSVGASHPKERDTSWSRRQSPAQRIHPRSLAWFESRSFVPPGFRLDRDGTARAIPGCDTVGVWRFKSGRIKTARLSSSIAHLGPTTSARSSPAGQWRRPSSFTR